MMKPLRSQNKKAARSRPGLFLKVAKISTSAIVLNMTVAKVYKIVVFDCGLG